MKEVGVGKKNEGRGDVWFGVTEGSSVCDERTTIISTELQDLEQDSWWQYRENKMEQVSEGNKKFQDKKVIEE